MTQPQPVVFRGGMDASARRSRYQAEGWWGGVPLVERFGRHVGDRPGAPAVRDMRSGWLTREQLWNEAGALTESMVAHGLGPGDVVLICLPNRVIWQSLFLACLRLGAIPATLPVTTDTATIGYVSALVGAEAIVTLERHRTRSIASEVLAGNAAPQVLVIGDEGETRWQRTTTTYGGRPEAIPGLCHLMFTSSTTGMPKAVAHTEDTLAAVNLGFAQRFGIDETSPIFMASPLGHSVGAWHGSRLSLFTGAPLVLQEVWDPAQALDVIEAEGCGFTAAATPFLKDLIDARWAADRPKLAPLRTFLCGGAPVPPALVAAAAEQMPHTFVTVLWGMTEGGVTTCRPGDPPERVAQTGGVGLPGLELCTLGPDGSPLPAGTEGELAMRGPGVFVGYYGQGDLYRELVTPQGFFRTGDLAVLDDAGYVRITGRLKDLIIRGGVNISPVPLENVLSAHPQIRRVAVVGTPDERMGERICVVIVPNGTAPSLDELLAWLRDKDFPQRQWPERLVVVDGMPQTAAGKIRKPALLSEILKGQS